MIDAAVTKSREEKNDMEESIRINSGRLWNSLMEMAKIGQTKIGGVRRLALTDIDQQARDLLHQWCNLENLIFRSDAIGNCFYRRQGSDSSLPPLVIGSHLDSQPTGGKYDGVYGVLAGLEVIRTLNERNIITKHPIDLVVWTNEEGSRFVPVMMGSGVFTGAIPLPYALNQTDNNGISVGSALSQLGYNINNDNIISRDIFGYLEIHIEQGPILELSCNIIGIVTGALGQRWFDVSILGEEAHAGPTPIILRRDALLAAADIVAEVRAIAENYAPDSRGTVGYLEVFPNSRNVIPGKVKLSIDFRARDQETLDAMSLDLRSRCLRDEVSFNVKISLNEVVNFKPQDFNESLVNEVRASADKCGYSNQEIVSGAGHDAVYLAGITPAAMIFIPCKDGLSHNELESISVDHAEAGCNVLLKTVISLAGGSS